MLPTSDGTAKRVARLLRCDAEGKVTLQAGWPKRWAGYELARQKSRKCRRHSPWRVASVLNKHSVADASVHTVALLVGPALGPRGSSPRMQTSLGFRRPVRAPPSVRRFPSGLENRPPLATERLDRREVNQGEPQVILGERVCHHVHSMVLDSQIETFWYLHHVVGPIQTNSVRDTCRTTTIRRCKTMSITALFFAHDWPHVWVSWVPGSRRITRRVLLCLTRVPRAPVFGDPRESQWHYSIQKVLPWETISSECAVKSDYLGPGRRARDRKLCC